MSGESADKPESVRTARRRRALRVPITDIPRASALDDSVEDDALSFGKTGLFMQTFEAPAAVVRFDDFTQDALG